MQISKHDCQLSSQQETTKEDERQSLREKIRRPNYHGIMNWGVLLKPVFMHNPIGFLSMWGSTLVENQRLPHSNSFKAAVDDLISSSGFPEPCCGGAVCSCPCGVLLIFVAEEVPIILWCGSYFAFLCKKF